MNYTEDELALLWLSAFSGVEEKERLALLRAESPAVIFRNFEKIAAKVISKEGKSVYKEGSYSERAEKTRKFARDLEAKGVFFVTSADGDYPSQLTFTGFAPPVLYGAGNRSLLKEEMFCIVGSRRTPPWAEKLGSRVSEELSSRFAIVTGLAEGGDCAALKGALAGGKAVCVLPCGLDECYPAAHSSLKEEVRRKGLLLSEFLPGEKTKKYSFHLRNRLLAGLSKGVLVLSAGEKSGALITAGYAADFGRDVFAFPYSLGTAQGVGCNELIKRGAYLCTGAEDIFDCYGIVPQKKKPLPLSEEEYRVFEILLQGEELHAAVVAERAGLQVFEAAAALSSLELKGYAVKAGGNRYSAVQV